MRGSVELNRPLSDDDWTALEEFLDAPGGPNVDAAVGFLTAVVTAPSTIPPSEWLSIVLGEREEDVDEYVLGLLLRLFNTVAMTLDERGVFHPDPDEVEEIEDWCTGYMVGVELDDVWIGDVEAMTPVFPIAVLAGEHELNEPGDDTHIADEAAWKQQAREELGALAFEAFELLEAKRRPLPAVPGGWVREGPKVGRNDPCPCGSGKKYKKCCA